MEEKKIKKTKADVSGTMIAFTKATMDKFLKEDNPADLIALYCFYYYTSKWQEQYNCRATKSYCAKGLKISDSRVSVARAKLLKMGLAIPRAGYQSYPEQKDVNRLDINHGFSF